MRLNSTETSLSSVMMMMVFRAGFVRVMVWRACVYALVMTTTRLLAELPAARRLRTVLAINC